ncbi:hypothetical protein Q4603_05670 [Zobellia galactanivorans]|uniref:hypothetical protein n=1 Tax=Zobellia galactanivorans (strain DSM 12802 / CCUG 47099 / CIP 106680 / NCIMB 13871 / Dsij) TaxID=63186 RepID=UPI0026E11440|nr:hypothetical protein [Zobellia galactanivorans]MDO6808083.1 hypothetical protein [Zobellia galactanivorans]
MQDFDPIDINFVINKNEVRQDAAEVKKELRGVGLEAESVIKKTNKQVSGIIYGKEEAEAEAKRIADIKKHYDDLRKKIQADRAKKSGTTFIDPDEINEAKKALEGVGDEVGKLGVETDGLSNSQDKASSGLGAVLGKFLAWEAILDVGLDLIKQYGPALLNYANQMWGSASATSRAALAQETYNKALTSSEYRKGLENIIELRKTLELAKDGLIDKTVVVEKYNDVIGDTAGKAENLTDVEQGLIDNADAYIEMTFKKAAANLALEEAAKKALEAEKRRQNPEVTDLSLSEQVGLAGNVPGSAGSFLANLIGSEIDVDSVQDRANKAASVLEKEGETLQDIYEKMISEAEAAAKKLNKSVFGSDEADSKKVYDQRKKLIEQINALDREYSRKQLSSNEAEIRAIEDKFERIRTLVTDFNNDPKNSEARISLTSLDELEATAVATQKYRQETRALKDELVKQQEFFKNYEEAKSTYGIEKANEMYDAQKGAYNDYLSFLKAKAAENKEALAAAGNGTATASQQERASLIDSELKKEQQERARHYQDLLYDLRDYEAERADLIAEYNALRAQLIANGNDAEAAELSRRFKETLDDLDLSNAERTKEYKTLMQGVDDLSSELARKVVEDARQMVAALVESGRLSKDAADQILKDIDRVESGIDRNDSQSTQELSRTFAQIGAELEKAGDKISASVGKMVTEMASAFGTLADNNSSTLQKATGLVSLIVSLGRMQKEIGGEQLNKVVNKQKLVTNELARQVTLETTINALRRERAEIERNQSAFLDSYYQDDFIAALSKRADSELELRDAMQKLSENGIFTAEGVGKRLLFGSKTENRDFSIQQILGDFSVGGLEDYDGFFVDPVGALLFGAYSDKNVSKDALKNLRNTFEDTLTAMGKTSSDMANFSSTEWLDFFTVIEAAGNIQDAATKELLANAKKAQEDYQEALTEMREVINDIAGSLGGDLRDSLVSAFQDGSDAADNFMGKLNNVINRLFLDQLINNQFRSYFDRLQEDMEASFGDGGDGSWIDDLKRFGDSIGPQTQAAIEAMKQFDAEMQSQGFAGLTGEDTSTSDSGLSGAIRRELTESTASELTGLYRNTLDITRRHLEMAEKAYLLDQRHYEGTIAIMKSSALIEQNTRNTVIQLGYVVSRLDDIKKNTKPIQTTRDLGI